ncbi:MAG TPA: hypothetical protein VD758_16465 [Gemmatimonadaceae bacterium]|nr:hypothetical protein [Gemmatimonadaceae bacterium]
MKKFLIALVSLSLACSSYDLTTPSQDSLTGRWNLTAVNDTPLPYEAPHIGTNKQEIIADVLTLTAPDTFSEATTIRITQNGQVTTATVIDSGTYTFNSYVVTFNFHSDGSSGSATLSGRTLKVNVSGIWFTYKKE